MPAKRKTQKEDILKASISIISHEGLNALNARKIAKKLGCSTQPLFYIYENMDVLKKDVIDEIVKIFDREVLKSETGQLEYKDIGINYIRFAKEEHELFKIMFNRKINEGAFDFIDLTGSAKTILETISKQTGMSNEDAKQFHLRMWLYVNGIASLAANQTVEFNDEEIAELLKDQYVSMLLYEVKKGNGFRDLNTYAQGCNGYLSAENRIKYLEMQLAYKDQEIEFLKKIVSLNPEAPE